MSKLVKVLIISTYKYIIPDMAFLRNTHANLAKFANSIHIARFAYFA
jgi:hypothetical protein